MSVTKSARRASQSQSNFLGLRKDAEKADELVDNALAAVSTAQTAKAFLDITTQAALSSSAAAAATHFLTVGTAMDVALLHDKSRKPLEEILRRDTAFASDEEVEHAFGQVGDILRGNDHKSGLVNHFNNILDDEALAGGYIAVWFGEESEQAGNQYSRVKICALSPHWKIAHGTRDTNTINLDCEFDDLIRGRAIPVDEIYIAQFKEGSECYVDGEDAYGVIAEPVGCTYEEWHHRGRIVLVLIDGANDPGENTSKTFPSAFPPPNLTISKDKNATR
ncbi:Hypothetical Protein FCC1311_077942 [Hondaea fermentalgiana]|uniref:Uncharacterized protein n=1 Tax=Hondaea fermentalgiana TaxID=2315210 RepID=A0A2R5GL21_9STRA|nr:Hypothetical Protein FCC1311_077942 [Hondaea fermentalgiana]|eukprot:GBG31570.1 Hypothetical Protein FCC1311_077942 [Hondaea fermentalgiana]